MDIVLHTSTSLELDGKFYRCATGSGGIVRYKTEGDHATPCGIFPLREVFYRPDRLARPSCVLPVFALTPECGWCDGPLSPFYNRYVRLPYPDPHEVLWRQDAVYDVILVLGYNDDPVIGGKGSAIFMHLARPGYLPTQGCIALAQEDLLEILRQVTASTRCVVPESLDKDL